MIIGIDASRAFTDQRTGIEEYSYQIIGHLMDKLDGHQVVLYLRGNQKIGLSLPASWRVKRIRFTYLWTQLGLSLELLFHPVDVLFVPGHVVPVIHPARNALLYNLSLKIHCLLSKWGIGTTDNGHCKAGGPKKTIVTVHGLEFEHMPEAFSRFGRMYMRWSIKMSCKWAKKIICVSRNTKEDLKNLYDIPENKMQVVYNGASEKSQITNHKSQINSKLQIQNLKPYLLFIGRLEKRKNIEGIIQAFEILKEKYEIKHKLFLAGGEGFGFDDTKYKILNTKYKEDIIMPGYVSDEEKFNLLKNADVFLFPSFYEGFGLPVLEAQSVGTPVVTSNVSSLPEVAGDGASYIDPNSPEFIASAAYQLITGKDFRDGIIEKGYENVKRFSWETCAEQIAIVILSE